MIPDVVLASIGRARCPSCGNDVSVNPVSGLLRAHGPLHPDAVHDVRHATGRSCPGGGTEPTACAPTWG